MDAKEVEQELERLENVAIETNKCRQRLMNSYQKHMDQEFAKICFETFGKIEPIKQRVVFNKSNTINLSSRVDRKIKGSNNFRKNKVKVIGIDFGFTPLDDTQYLFTTSGFYGHSAMRLSEFSFLTQKKILSKIKSMKRGFKILNVTL